MTPTLFIVLALTYFVTLFYLVKKDSVPIENSKQYSFGSTASSPWAIAMSIFATYISSIGFLAVPGKSFATNWISITICLSIPIVYWMMGRWFLLQLYNIPSISMYGFLEKKMGRWATRWATLACLGFNIGRIGIVLHLAALFFHEIIGVDHYLLLASLCAFTTAYSCFGGFKAIIVTDVLQAIFLLSSAFFLLVYVGLHLDSQQWQFLMDSPDKLSLGEVSLDFTKQAFFPMVLYGVFQHLNVFCGSQISVQQFKAAKNVKDAKKALALGLLLSLTAMVTFTLLGTLLFGFFEGGKLLPAHTGPDAVVAYFIKNELNIYLQSFIYIGLFSAAMSSLDSAINPSSVIFYESFVPKKESGVSEVYWLRSSGVLVSLLGLLVAIGFANQKTIIDIWWEMSGFFGIILTALMVAALFKLKVSFVNFVFGMTLTGLFYASIKMGWNPVNPIYIGVFGAFFIWIFPIIGKLTSAKAPIS